MNERFVPQPEPVDHNVGLDITNTTLPNGDAAQVWHWHDGNTDQVMIVPEYGDIGVVTNEGHGWHGKDEPIKPGS